MPVIGSGTRLGDVACVAAETDDMWEKVELPGYIFERMVGFSLPADGEVAIVSFEGVHIIDLESPGNVLNDDRYPEGKGIYDERKQVLVYEGKIFKMLGVFGGEPILDSSQGEQLVFDLEKEILKVRQNNATLFQFDFEDLSGDWGYATFSSDSAYMLLGLPYDIYIFQRN